MAVDDEAIASTVFLDLQNGRVRLGFPTCAVEIDAIARGKRFAIDRDFEMNRVLVCTPTSTTAKLQDESGVTGYEIAAQKSQDTRALAWIESGNPPYVKAHPIQIVDKITGDDQIVIKAEGAAEVSGNLIGQTLRSRIPVFVDKRVTVLLEPLECFTLHVIAEKPELTYLCLDAAIAKTSPSSQGGTRWLEGTFDPSQVKTESICENCADE